MSIQSAWENLLGILEEQSHFKVSEGIKNASSEDIYMMLILGEKSLKSVENNSIDEKLKMQLIAKDDSMERAMQTTMTNYNHIISKLEADNKRLTLDYERLLSLTNDQKDVLRLQIQKEMEIELSTKFKQSQDLVVGSLQEQIKTLQKTCDLYEKDKINIQLKYDALNEKLPHMNMVAMGNIGQHFVEDMTRQAFNYECEIVSTSQDPHCMDVKVNTPDGFIANLEIKAADPVQTVRDVNKYHRDLQELIDRSEINASALLSLKAPIPNYKSGTLIMKVNSVGLKIPVLYVHVTSEEILKHSLNLLKEIQKLCQLEHTARGSEPVPIEVQKYQQEKLLLRQTIPDIFKESSEEEDQIVLQLDHMKRIREISENKLAKLQMIRQVKLRLQDTLPWLFDDQNSHSTKLQKAISIWETYKEKHKKDPANLTCFGTDEPFIKHVGFAKLKEAVREQRKRDRNTDETVIKKIKTNDS